MKSKTLGMALLGLAWLGFVSGLALSLAWLGFVLGLVWLGPRFGLALSPAWLGLALSLVWLGLQMFSTFLHVLHKDSAIYYYP